MKKLFVTTLMVLSLMVLPFTAIAGWGIPIGKVDIDVAASNSDYSYAMDFSFSPFGPAGGGGSMDAYVEGGAYGIMINGKISAIAPTETNFAGGYSDSGNTPDLGTWTHNFAATGGQLDLTASSRFGIGGVAGGIDGYAEQCSLNIGGGLYGGGNTAGLATQESAGGFEGSALTGSILRGETAAGFEASIIMDGYSATNSYKWSNNGKGLGTYVEAGTTIASSGGSYDDGCISYATVDGGFNASGSVGSLTEQSRNGGYASASANGSYSGAGSLGSTYNGSAFGYTETFAGDNGVMHVGAGMTVTSMITNTPN